jgi:hypothetical protein
MEEEKQRQLEPLYTAAKRQQTRLIHSREDAAANKDPQQKGRGSQQGSTAEK